MISFFFLIDNIDGNDDDYYDDEMFQKLIDIICSKSNYNFSAILKYPTQEICAKIEFNCF